ncbi:MAG TPA: flagellar hook protein FlgE [Urbifossiella sp.]|jgi:flagellar hook protein FlgE|nr:flagellar hook protein FlgE [Urbifossiella sp.]
MALNALFIGASGLQANSSALDVVGQNLANLNTTGYKSQRALFQDLVYQTMNTGSAPSGSLGGTNPTQEGTGVQIGALGSLFQQGSVTPTGRSLDAAIQGDGFFEVSNGQSTQFTRSGAFDVDAGGFLVDPNTGFRVQRTGSVGESTPTAPGFQVSGDNDIRVPFGAGLPGIETGSVTLQGNLSNSMAVGATTTAAIQVYDSQSTPRALTMTFTKTADNTFNVTADIGGGTATVTGNPITFDSSGLLTGPASLSVALSGLTGAANQTVSLNLGTPGQSTGITQFGGASTAAAVTQDGSGFGTLTGVSFTNDGTVQGQFSNGRTTPIAQLAIAGFNNESGLLRGGNNYFSASAASGQAIVGPAGSGGRGTVQGGSLEGSNVDVASEFSKLIIAQRGFQVDAQTITAANETLQTLANIIR